MRCDRCGRKIDCPTNFCPYCGEQAPRKTVIFDEKPRCIDNPKYCPDCGKPNIKEAMYCLDCGEGIYLKPQKEVIFCGRCGEKNDVKALLCCSCGQSFENWFEMKGEIAEEFGYKGNLILKEKMTEMKYYFSTNAVFNIGKNPNNDLVIPCKWVSRSHCRIELKNKRLIDSSVNGTFINRSPEHIKNEALPFVNEFNVAGSFTFNFLKRRGAYCLHLGAILDEDECRRDGDGEAFDLLRNNWYVLYDDDFRIDIQKLDGQIARKRRPGVSMYIIRVENGYYYYTDKDRGIERVLIMKDYNTLPANWEIKFQD